MLEDQEANILYKDITNNQQTNELSQSFFVGTAETVDKPLKNINRERNFGKMIVWKEKPIFLSLGPDYLCFLPTFIIFSIVSYILIHAVFSNTQNIWIRLTTLFICIGQCISYLLMAISNPGVAHQNSPNSNKLCKKCNIFIQKGTYHCRDCQICVIGYDHHCTWTSKCVGKNNIIRFYVFLGFTSLFLIYCMVATIILLGDAAISASLYNLRHNAAGHVEKSFH